MKMKITMILLLGALVAPTARAESGAYGFRIYPLDWKEQKLFGENSVSEDITAFGPSFLFRFGGGDALAVGLDGYYGSGGDLDRAELEGRFIYSPSDAFDISLDLRHTRYDYTARSGERKVEISTRGTGPGLGLHVQAPLGEFGFIAFGSTRGMAMSMSTDVQDVSDRWTFLWLYELGIAYAQRIEMGLPDTSFYLAAGYRHQQMRGGDFDETVQMPFVEFGVRQQF